MTIEQTLILAGLCSLSAGGLVLFLTYHRWYVPLRVLRKVERLRREEAAGTPPSPRDYHYAISFDSECFTVADLRSRKPEPIVMRWADICRATAFKRDLFAVDCICLFLARADGTGVEVDEEMARWKSFVEALPQHLPGCRSWPGWFSMVAFPAFAANETQIYDRTGLEMRSCRVTKESRT
jgi:hypothetical protein